MLPFHWLQIRSSARGRRFFRQLLFSVSFATGCVEKKLSFLARTIDGNHRVVSQQVPSY